MKRSSRSVLLLSALAALSLVGCAKPVEPVSSSKEASAEPEKKKYKIEDDLSDHVMAVGIPAEAEEGAKITFSLTVEPGYEITGAAPVVTSAGADVPLTENEDGTYSFTMPSDDVKITEASKKAKYGISTDLAYGLSAEVYKKTTMGEAYQQSYYEVSGTYEGALTSESSSQSELDLTLILSPDGKVEIPKMTSTGDDSAKGTFTLNVKKDADGNEATYVSFQAEGSSATYSGVFVFQMVGGIGGELGELKVQTFARGSVNSIYVTNYTPGQLLDRQKEPEPYDANALVYVPCDGIPDIGNYLDTYLYQINPSNESTVDTFTLDGKEVQPNEEGYYEVTLPRHSVEVSIFAKTRYAPLKVSGANHVTAKAYVKNSADQYVEATEAKYNDQVYFKVEIPDGADVTLRDLTVVYNKDGWSVSLANNLLKLNDDGYYTCDQCVMSDMDSGIELQVNERFSFFTDQTLIGKAAAFGVGDAISTSSIEINSYGDLKVTSGTSTTEYYFSSADIASNQIHIHSTGNPGTAYWLWHDGAGHAAFLSSGAYNLNFISLFQIGVESGASVSWMMDDTSSAYNSSLALGTWSDGTNTTLAYFDVSDAKNPVVAIDVTANVLNSSDEITGYAVAGAVFDLMEKDGTTIAATLRASSSKRIVKFKKGVVGTFTGSLGDLVSTGTGMTIAGETPVLLAFDQEDDGTNIASFILNQNNELYLSAVSFDATAHTYSEVSGRPFHAKISGHYLGEQLNFQSSGITMAGQYDASFGGSGVTAPDSKAPYTGAVAFRDNFKSTVEEPLLGGDGSLTAANSVWHFSPDGETARVTVSSSYSSSTSEYLVSRSITADSAYQCAKLSSIPYLDGYLLEELPADSSKGSRNYDALYYDKVLKKFAWPEISLLDGATDYAATGTRLTIEVNGVTSGTLVNVGGSFVDDFSGTYKVGTDDLVIQGLKGTYLGSTMNGTYNEDGTITFTKIVQKDDGTYDVTTYVATLDQAAMTATIVSHSQNVPYLWQGVSREGNVAAWTKDDAGNWASPSGFTSGNVCWVDFSFGVAGTFSFDWAVSSSWGNTIQIKQNDSFVSGFDDTWNNNYSSKSGSQSFSVAAGDKVSVGYYRRYNSTSSSSTDNVKLTNIVFTVA